MGDRGSSVDAYSGIELGRDDYSRSLVRALDIGALIWEGETAYRSLDAAPGGSGAGHAAGVNRFTASA